MIHEADKAKAPAPGYYGWYDDTPNADLFITNRYRQWPAVSGSFIGNADNWRSAKHLQLALDAPPKAATAEMNLGTALHEMVLLGIKVDDVCVVAPDVDRRTKAGKQEYAEAAQYANDEGLVLLTEEQVEHLEGMADAISSNDDAAELLMKPRGERTAGLSEGSMVWRENGVLCKGRWDRLQLHELAGTQATLVDVKSTRNASSEFFEREILNRGMHVQLDHYRSGIVRTPIQHDAVPEYMRSWYAEGDGLVSHESCVRVAIIAVENTAPYGCTVFWLDEQWMAIASEARTKRLNMIRRAMERDEWGGYPTRFESCPPRWALPAEDQALAIVKEAGNVF